MKPPVLSKIPILLMLFIGPVVALADAIVVSQAMFASTIAEYFVEEDHIRVELEIGMNDIEAFRNLMPDAIYQEMGHGSEPMEERLKLFFERDFVIYSEGKPLQGHIAKMGPEARIQRDPVTGDPVPDDTGILEVQPHMITVLTDTATRGADLDEASAKAAKAEAERQLADRTGELEVTEAQSQLMQAVAQLAALESLRKNVKR